METAIKRSTRRIAASIAIATALATSCAWAATYWTGKGANSYFTTAENWDTANFATDNKYFRDTRIKGNWKRLMTIGENHSGTGTWNVQLGSEADPFVFQNNAAYTTTGSFTVGDSTYTAGTIFRDGIFNGNGLGLGGANKTAYLCLDGTTLNLSGTANLNNGKFVCEGSSTFTAKYLYVGNVTNGVVTIEKNSGDWTFSETPKFGTATGSVVRVCHRGGSMKSGYMDVGVDNVPADVEFEISGGVITNTLYATINSNSKMTVKGPGRLVSTRKKDTDDYLIGLYIKNGTLNITDGGEVSVPYSGAHLTRASGETAIVNISNGGILSAKRIYNKDNGTAKINLDGGIIRACADHTEFINTKSKFDIYIGSNGGTIDTAGHAVTIAEDLQNASGKTGFVRFAGGGIVTLTGKASYSGATLVTSGTKLVVSQATAKDGILNNGLVVEGVPSAGDEIFVVTSGPDDTISEEQLAKVTCPLAPETTFALGEGNTNIVVQSVGGLAPACWTGAAGDNNLSTAENWSDGVVPTSGNPVISCSAPATLTVGGTFRADTITIPEYSAVVTLADALTLNSLTNAGKLAVASTGSLTVTGDLVGYAGSNENKPLLYSNYGTVTVGGIVRFRDCGTSKNECYVSQYAVADENTTPIIANGLAYHAAKTDAGAWYTGWLVANLGSIGNGPGKWVVGAGGLTFPLSRDISHSGFRADNQEVTLYSSADWTLNETYRHTGNDLYIRGTGKVTIDTTDYNDHTTPRTVTLKGYINAQGSVATPLTVTGKGKVVLASVPYRYINEEDPTKNYTRTNIVNGAIAVGNGATLQINGDVVVGGSGTISLAAGATLALPANGDNSFSVRDIVPLTLPETGTVTLRIDGDARLPAGEYTLFDFVPENYANLTVDRDGTAIAGRKAEVFADPEDAGKLKLRIIPDGLILIFR